MTAVIGAGSWGTTLALLAAAKGEPVRLWARNPNVVAYMNAERESPRYLPGATLPPQITVTSSLKEALDGESVILHVVPSHVTRDVARDYAPHLAADSVVISCTKGLEHGTHKRMSEVIGEETNRTVGALSGPNHAEEIVRGQPTAAVIAHPDLATAERVTRILETNSFKAYPRRDLVGTEVCGAYKNVVALAAGMADGLGWGDNCLACLVTLGVDEMVALSRVMGGDDRTVQGLAGIGDLVATSTSRHSRNRRFGRELARGVSRKDIERGMHGMVAEGVRATKAFYDFAQEEQLELPLTRVVHAIVYEGVAVMDGVEELLARV